MSERNMSVRGQCENKTQLRWYVTRIADGNLVYICKKCSQITFLSFRLLPLLFLCFIANQWTKNEDLLFLFICSFYILSVDPNIVANSYAISLPCVVNKSKLIYFNQISLSPSLFRSSLLLLFYSVKFVSK